MSAAGTKTALIALQWTLGVVILIEAGLFVMPGSAHDFARSRMPNFIRLILGWVEVAGCILFLIPRTAVRGAWVLVAVFTVAILIHVLHGMYGVGNLVIYIAAAFAVAVSKSA
jgi:hypothetical protein